MKFAETGSKCQTQNTSADREALYGFYGPGQGVIEGKLLWTSQSRIKFLANIAEWLNKEDTRPTAYKCIAKADEIWPDDASIIDRHFALSTMCKVFYRWRDADEFALDKAISACWRSVAMQHEAAAAFKQPGHALPWGNGLPGHYCFTKLAIIEEKRGNVSAAIEVCGDAIQGGWPGDWEKRIARLRKKEAKAAK